MTNAALKLNYAENYLDYYKTEYLELYYVPESKHAYHVIYRGTHHKFDNYTDAMDFVGECS